MKDYPRSELDIHRPHKSPLECVEYSLECLYRDRIHRTSDAVSGDLTYGELIGALLHARDAIITSEGESP